MKKLSLFITLVMAVAFFGNTAYSADYTVNVVLDKTKKMAIINPDTYKVEKYVPLPVLGTHGVAPSPDGKYVYVNAMPPGDIAEIDVARGGVSKWFPIKETKKNCGIQVTPDGAHIISASQSKQLIVLNRVTGEYTAIATPTDAHQFNFGPDGNVYVAGGKSGEVFIIDWKKRKMVGQFKVGKMPHGVTFSPDGKKILVSLRGENRVAILDAASKKEVGSIPIKVTEGGLCNIALMPDNKTYWLAETFGRAIHIIDAKSMKPVKRFDVDGEPHHAIPTTVTLAPSK
jgi:YVTN family beta-propeller protein